MGMFDHLLPEAQEQQKRWAPGKGISENVDPLPPSSTPNMFAHLLPETRVDFTRPIEEIRAQIAKLPADQQKAAQDAWADLRIAKTPGLSQPSPARGIPIIGSLTDEMVGGAQAGLHALTGGYLGLPYDEAVAEERARARQSRRKAPIETAIAEIAGGIVAGGPLLAKLTPGKTLAAQTAQGAAVGGPLAWLEGLASEGSAEDRLNRASANFGPGVVVGAAAPAVIRGVGAGVASAADALSPQIARVQGALHGLRDKLAIKASADGRGPAVSHGADAAADQIIANQLARANMTVPELRQRFIDADDAARLDSNSFAQNVLAPVDIDPSLQRLAGSVARQQPEAANIGTAFQYARQTGQPSGLPLPAEVNIPTRPPLAKPAHDDPPMGQFERIGDALKRALRIEDDALHGHGKSAYATEQLVMKRARADADKLYGETYKAAEGIDIRPAIMPTVQKWAERVADEPVAVGSAIKQMLRQFTNQDGEIVRDLRRFQKAKEFSDGVIRKWLQSPESRNQYVGGVLTELKNDMLAAVDAMPKIGPLYKTARDQFSGEMSLRDALKLGRDMLKEDGEVAVDQFRQLATEGERKMARLGLWEAFKQLGARKGRTDDVTKIFTTPRVQEIIEAMVPRPRGADAVFANRPERFGQYISNEQRMISTRNQTMGNSKTAERMADDEALNNMQSMIEAAKNSASNPSASGFVLRLMETTIAKLFGFRADTAAAIARKLYTANPAEREVLLQAIERRMGPGRAAQFARVMAELSRPASSSSVSAYGSPHDIE